MTTTVSLYSSIFGKGQSTNFVELVKLNETHKLRITIHTDSHRPQAYAKIERWDGNQWQVVWHTHGDQMKTNHELGYLPRAAVASDFRQDRLDLLERAQEILF